MIKFASNFVSKNLWWWPQIYNEIKEHEEEEKSDFKMSKVMKFTFQNHIQPCAFEHHFSWLVFEDLNMTFENLTQP